VEKRIGSSKIMTAVKPGVIAMQFTDGWSAFERGTSPQTIPLMGRARCACAVKSFEVARKGGVPTHFIEQVDERTIHVQEFGIEGKRPLSGEVAGTVIDLEWLYRTSAAGSLLRRLATKEIKPEDLGFASGTEVTKGMRLPRMIVSCTTKREAIDRHLKNKEAAKLAGLSESEWHTARIFVEELAKALQDGFALAGFDIWDGKDELAWRHGGLLVAVDTFGTQDENRIIDHATGHNHDKDIIRDYLEVHPWMDQLNAAKAAHPTDKSKWPPYPVLPDWLVAVVVDRYCAVAGRYAQVRISG
jgi:phosphoribosylaminoimidazole-succinocarboxamide synthase